jgi:hypothetical protein
MKSNKIKVGIVGEHPTNDSQALQVLLNKVAKTDIHFSTYPKKFDGGQLDGQKFLRTLKVEAQFLDWIILVRDLDGFLSHSIKLKEKEKWFQICNDISNNKGIFFLVVYEMEALILADIDSFNQYYGLKTKPIGNPLLKENPKELLEKLTAKTQKGKYDENDAIKIFQILDFNTIYKTHKGEYSFQSFADELKDKRLIEF